MDAFLDGRNHEKYHYFCCSSGSSGNIYSFVLSHKKKRLFIHLIMAFFSSAINILQTLVVAIGAGLGVWGVINLMEGYGNDNPGANAHVR